MSSPFLSTHFKCKHVSEFFCNPCPSSLEFFSSFHKTSLWHFDGASAYLLLPKRLQIIFESFHIRSLHDLIINTPQISNAELIGIWERKKEEERGKEGQLITKETKKQRTKKTEGVGSLWSSIYLSPNSTASSRPGLKHGCKAVLGIFNTRCHKISPASTHSKSRNSIISLYGWMKTHFFSLGWGYCPADSTEGSREFTTPPKWHNMVCECECRQGCILLVGQEAAKIDGPMALWLKEMKIHRQGEHTTVPREVTRFAPALHWLYEEYLCELDVSSSKWRGHCLTDRWGFHDKHMLLWVCEKSWHNKKSNILFLSLKENTCWELPSYKKKIEETTQ